MLQPFIAIYRFARALAREAKTLIMVGPRILAYRLTRSEDEWQGVLPVQRASEITIADDAMFGEPERLAVWLMQGGTTMPSGFDSLYLSPRSWASSPLAGVARRYPAGAGLKLSKSGGDLDSHYAVTIPGRKSQSNFGFAHRKQGMLYAFLHLQGVAPRIYDTIRFTDGTGRCRIGYVVQDIEGGPPDADAFRAMVDRIKSLRDRDLLHLTSAGGWRGVDFQPPDANGNMIRSAEDGRTYYVDVHNFILGRYGRYLDDLARSVAGTSHFGNRSRILGGSGGGYLYQEIPGARLPAKRSPRARMATFDDLLTRAGLSLSDKVVLDIGCNLGLMGAECLRRGARWLHGWDLPEVVSAAGQVLPALGCTRFSLTPARLHDGIDLGADLPPHLRDLDPDEVVIGYFAIRGHVNWLPALSKLPWRWMLYEGHQGDRPLEDELSGLGKLVTFSVRATGSVAEANTFRRQIAIIERHPDQEGTTTRKG